MLSFFRNVFLSHRSNHAADAAAAVAFYAILSLPALTTLVLAGMKGILDSTTTQQTLLHYATLLFGAEATHAIEPILIRAPTISHNTLITMLGVGVLIFSATTCFAALYRALDQIFEVPHIDRTVRTMLRHRLGAVLIIFLLCALFLLALLFNLLSSALLPQIPFMAFFSHAITILIALFLITSIFLLVPDTEVSKKSAFVGALVTTILFFVGKSLLLWYVSHATTAYGALGSLVLILLFIYYSAQIFFFGATVANTYGTRH